MLGKKHTPEARAKISESNKRENLSAESRANKKNAAFAREARKRKAAA